MNGSQSRSTKPNMEGARLIQHECPIDAMNRSRPRRLRSSQLHINVVSLSPDNYPRSPQFFLVIPCVWVDIYPHRKLTCVRDIRVDGVTSAVIVRAKL